MRKDEEDSVGMGVKEGGSPLRQKRGDDDDEDVFGWDVKKLHDSSCLMRNDDVEDVFRMDVKKLLHIFPLQSTATGKYCS
jgi:hypothetical protein